MGGPVGVQARSLAEVAALEVVVLVEVVLVVGGFSPELLLMGVILLVAAFSSLPDCSPAEKP